MAMFILGDSIVKNFNDYFLIRVFQNSSDET